MFICCRCGGHYRFLPNIHFGDRTSSIQVLAGLEYFLNYVVYFCTFVSYCYFLHCYLFYVLNSFVLIKVTCCILLTLSCSAPLLNCFLFWFPFQSLYAPILCGCPDLFYFILSYFILSYFILSYFSLILYAHLNAIIARSFFCSLSIAVGHTLYRFVSSVTWVTLPCQSHLFRFSAKLSSIQCRSWFI